MKQWAFSKAFRGAMIGALVAFGIPVVIATISVIKYKDDVGADIGLGLLLLGFPIYLFFAIAIGWMVGWILDKKDSRGKSKGLPDRHPD